MIDPTPDATSVFETDLPARLEQAAAGSRELSDEVLEAMGWRQRRSGEGGILLPDEAMIVDPDGKQHIRSAVLDPTISVDDGLALAGDDWFAILEEAMQRFGQAAYQGTFVTLQNLPLFICAALVRARAKQQEDLP